MTNLNMEYLRPSFSLATKRHGNFLSTLSEFVCMLIISCYSLFQSSISPCGFSYFVRMHTCMRAESLMVWQ